MTKHFLIMALRTLIRNKVYSLINIAGLAISMTCFIFILLWANDELNYNRYHKNIDDIYCVLRKTNTTGFHFGSNEYLSDVLKTEFPQIKKSIRIYGCYADFSMEYQNQYFHPDVQFADSTLFDVFDFEFIEGNPKEALQKPLSLVVTQKAAKKYFGTLDCLGKQITVSDKYVFTITALVKDNPKNSEFQTEFISNLSYLFQSQQAFSGYFYTYVLLNSNTNPDFLAKNWKSFSQKHRINFEAHLYPYKDVYLYDPLDWYHKPINKVRLFIGIGILILVVACINFINLTTASYLQRSKEIGIRQTLGSNRWQLIQRFMSEAFVVGTSAIILATILVVLLLPYFNQFTEKEVQIRTLNLSFWLELVLVFFLTVCISGFYPALYLSRLKPNLLLKTSFSKSNKAVFRKSLIVFQFSISIFLIVVAMVINNQLQFMKSKELGYNITDLCYLKLASISQKNEGTNYSQSSPDSKTEKMKSELQKCPFIESVSIGDLPHLCIGNSTGKWEGMDKKDTARVILFCRIDYDYEKTAGIKIIEGRFINKGIKNEMLVNQTLAKIISPKTSVIGKSFVFDAPPAYTIVGVVQDFQDASLKRVIYPFVLMPWISEHYPCISIRYVHGCFAQTKTYINQTAKKLGIKEEISIGSIDSILKDQYKSEESQFQLFTIFSLLAILISCLGMIGLSLFETNRRTKEIGVRRVNGASFLQMIVLLNRSFLKWVGIAFIVAVPISYYVMNRWLQDFAYRTSLSWWIFALSGLIALVIGLVSTSYQTLRAAKRNPIESLRYE